MDSIHRAVFTAAMARNKFVLILQTFRFNDESSGNKQKTTDELASISEVLDWFVERSF